MNSDLVGRHDERVDLELRDLPLPDVDLDRYCHGAPPLCSARACGASVGSEVEPRKPPAERGRDFVVDGAPLVGDLVGRDPAAHLLADQDELVVVGYIMAPRPDRRSGRPC